MNPPARTKTQRRIDTLYRLEHDIDCWVATADAGGAPYMMPLSFLWDNETLLLSTNAANPTARNLVANGAARIGIGLTRDVILIEGAAETLDPAELSQEEGDAFAVKTGFDPRALKSPYLYFRVRPLRLQAWREVNELEERDLIVDGVWVE
ncbi:pyridoxamine 5'-phosphate oxidase family protein [Nonomuraea sp. NPDC050556]|uniref:pyridoxamine 5'-phosphate oxidase family protein n=1 Tax=Nonomuraea sp. NPDC050556 TaxID=3364369 RepID=UPI003790E35F